MTSAAMESLSGRGASNLINIMSRIPKSILEPSSDADQIDLSFAENWVIREEVLDVLKDVMEKGYHAHHLDWPQGFWGDCDLIESLADLFNAYFSPHATIGPKQVVVAPGASACLDAIFYNICNPGDGVLIPCPYWNGYEPFLRAHSGAVPIAVELIDLEASFSSALISALEERLQTASCPIKAVLLANPHNPLGRFYSKEVLEECLQFCQRNQLHLVSDEVFALSEFNCSNLSGGRSFVSALSLDAKALNCDPQRLHVVWSMSKDLAASGARLGAVATRNEDLRNAIALIASANVSTISTVFSKELLRSPKLNSMLQLSSTRLGEAHSTLVAFFESAKISYLSSQATTFVMAQLAPRAKNREEELHGMAKYLEAGVLLSPAFAYHMPSSYIGWFRISFAVGPTKLATAIERMRSVYGTLLADK